MEIRRKITSALLLAAALLPLAATGCRTGPSREARRPDRWQAAPPLVGEAAFAELTVRVRATVAAGAMGVPGGGGVSPRPPAGGGGMPMGGPPGGSGMGGPPSGSGGMGAPPTGGGWPMAGGAGPSHALTVTFTNTGTETVEFSIVDVKSRLGNFAPQPDVLALAPGQSGTLYPMRGNIPEDVGELELTVAVRTRDGRTETRVILLRPVPEAGAGSGR